jgi:hypothetical protein
MKNIKVRFSEDNTIPLHVGVATTYNTPLQETFEKIRGKRLKQDGKVT